MFLAGKASETPRSLKDVIPYSYEIIHHKDPYVAKQIKQKEVYEQQEEIYLLGERLVIATLGFHFDVQLPYQPLRQALLRFGIVKGDLPRVARSFIYDGMRTTLCLQFMPNHIAAAAFYLAVKFLKMKLPSDVAIVWWQEFDINQDQLKEVTNEMLELHIEGNASAEGGTSAGVEEPTMNEGESLKQISSSHTTPEHTEKFEVPLRGTESQGNDESADIKRDDSVSQESKPDDVDKDKDSEETID